MFLQQNSRTQPDSVPFAREFAEKYPKDIQYPWALRILLIDELKKKNTKKVLRLYREIVSSKKTKIQEQFTEPEHGYFNRYGFDLKQERFIDKGGKK